MLYMASAIRRKSGIQSMEGPSNYIVIESFRKNKQNKRNRNGVKSWWYSVYELEHNLAIYLFTVFLYLDRLHTIRNPARISDLDGGGLRWPLTDATPRKTKEHHSSSIAWENNVCKSTVKPPNWIAGANRSGINILEVSYCSKSHE